MVVVVRLVKITGLRLVKLYWDWDCEHGCGSEIGNNNRTEIGKTLMGLGLYTWL